MHNPSRCVTIKKTQCEEDDYGHSESDQRVERRDRVRTLEDWEAARRTPPEYIPRLIGYQLKYEALIAEREDR